MPENKTLTPEKDAPQSDQPVTSEAEQRYHFDRLVRHIKANADDPTEEHQSQLEEARHWFDEHLKS